MGEDMGNGKTYTEVVLEFSDRLDHVEQRIISRLDALNQKVDDLAVGGASHKTLLDQHERRLEAHSEAIETLKRSDRIWGAVTATLAAISAAIGWPR